jgi:hypothetical protein
MLDKGNKVFMLVIDNLAFRPVAGSEQRIK